MSQIKNKETALITGASGGIGWELAKLFGQEGFDLVLVARDQAKLVSAAKQLQDSYGVQVEVISADLTQAEAPQMIFENLKNKNIDVLVNNAGFGLFGAFAETEKNKELDMIEVNVMAVTKLTKLFLPSMVARKKGRILNLASTAAFQPGPLMAVYYATKAYVLSFSEALAEELEGSGVTVTALCPGPTETGFQKMAQMEGSKLVKGKISDAASVAKFGFAALMKGERVVVPGTMNRVMAFSIKFMPRKMVTKIVRKAQEKERHA